MFTPFLSDSFKTLYWCKDSMSGCRNKSAYLKQLSTLEAKISEGLADFAVCEHEDLRRR